MQKKEKYNQRQITEDDISTILKIMGNELYRMRKNKGINGTVLGERLGISQQQVSRYENGITRLDFGMLLSFLISLDSSLHEFIYRILGQLKMYSPIIYLKYHSIFITSTEIKIEQYSECLSVSNS